MGCKYFIILTTGFYDLRKKRGLIGIQIPEPERTIACWTLKRRCVALARQVCAGVQGAILTCDCVFPPACGLQGLFRVAPSASKLKKLKASLDCGVLDVQEYSSDPHAIAGQLHQFLGEKNKKKHCFFLFSKSLTGSQCKVFRSGVIYSLYIYNISRCSDKNPRKPRFHLLNRRKTQLVAELLQRDKIFLPLRFKLRSCRPF